MIAKSPVRLSQDQWLEPSELGSVG